MVQIVILTVKKNLDPKMDVLPMPVWVSSGFSGFLQPLNDMPVDELATLNCF